MRAKNLPSRKEYYCPSGLAKWMRFLKILWVNFLWHRYNPYGYCDGYNWATCVTVNFQSCPCIRYGIHCDHIFSLYDPRFDSREAWEQYRKFREDGEREVIENAYIKR